MKIFTSIGILLVLASAVVNAANMVPYAESFESYAVGFEMPGTNGWLAATFSDAVVSTNAASIAALNTYSEPCGYPIRTASHDKMLSVAGTVSNSFSMAANQTVWVDMMMEIGLVDSIDAGLLSNAQVATYFNTEGHPMVYHYDGGEASNRWTEIPEITKSGWVRTTVGLNYQTDHFQIKMDGSLLTNVLGNTSSDGSGSAGGSWFAMPTAASQLNLVVLDAQKGGGLDDLIVTTVNPFLPILASFEYFSGDVLKLVVDFPNAMVLPESFHPIKSTSLTIPSWVPVQHSTNGVDWTFANLDYSATEGSNRVIYLQATDDTAFFGLGE